MRPVDVDDDGAPVELAASSLDFVELDSVCESFGDAGGAALVSASSCLTLVSGDWTSS